MALARVRRDNPPRERIVWPTTPLRPHSTARDRIVLRPYLDGHLAIALKSHDDIPPILWGRKNQKGNKYTETTGRRRFYASIFYATRTENRKSANGDLTTKAQRKGHFRTMQRERLWVDGTASSNGTRIPSPRGRSEKNCTTNPKRIRLLTSTRTPISRFTYLFFRRRNPAWNPSRFVKRRSTVIPKWLRVLLGLTGTEILPRREKKNGPKYVLVESRNKNITVTTECSRTERL